MSEHDDAAFEHDDDIELGGPLTGDDGAAFGLPEEAGDAEDGLQDDAAARTTPVPTPEDLVALAQVQAALQARAGETQVELRLDATAQACELLGDIQQSAPVITVTGTNGKSSTVRMVDALLSAHDLRVGRFSSPHLSRLTERISVGGEEVSPATLREVYSQIAPYLEIVDAQLAKDDRPPLTCFEALTVLAFAVFADAPVDVIVLEVGMGGEWDSTNVADAAVCGFTPVGLDHQEFLGDTVEKIAATKAGILNRTLDPSPAPQPIAVIAPQVEEVTEVFEHEVAARGVQAFWAGSQFSVVERSRAVDGQLLNLQGIYAQYPQVFLPLHGAHQADNAAVALAIVESFLATEDKPLDADVVGAGFASVTSPGRVEILRSAPTVIVDAAHNPAGMKVLADTLDEAFDFTDVVAVLAIFKDKDPHGILEYVHRFAGRVIVTQSQSPRAMPVDDLAAAATEWFDADGVIQAADMNAAMMKAIDFVVNDDEANVGIVVTGSVTTVAEARTLLGAKGA